MSCTEVAGRFVKVAAKLRKIDLLGTLDYLGVEFGRSILGGVFIATQRLWPF